VRKIHHTEAKRSQKQQEPDDFVRFCMGEHKTSLADENPGEIACPQQEDQKDPQPVPGLQIQYRQQRHKAESDETEISETIQQGS